MLSLPQGVYSFVKLSYLATVRMMGLAEEEILDASLLTAHIRRSFYLV